MSKTKKHAFYSKSINKNLQNLSNDASFTSKLQDSKNSILSNIQIGGTTITQLNEIVWKSLRSDISIKTCYKCPLCYEIYAQGKFEPICLPCGHTFCRQCLSKLKNSLWSGKCPFDSVEFYLINDLLPVNYSLLDCDSDPCPNTCPEHNSSLIAFCVDDLKLLCGRCLFSHHGHRLIELSSEKASEISKQNLENFKKLEYKLKELLISWGNYRDLLVGDGEPFKCVLTEHVLKLRKVESDIVHEIHERTERLIGVIQDYQEVLTVKGIENAEKVVECIKFHIECAESFSRYYPNMNACERLAVNIIYEDVFQEIINISLDEWKELGLDQYRKLILPTG